MFQVSEIVEFAERALNYIVTIAYRVLPAGEVTHAHP
jgi:hypothetical protein